MSAFGILVQNSASTKPTTPDSRASVPVGFCHCCCGRRTKITKHTDYRYGLIKGQPARFVTGHNNRKPSNPVVHLPDGISVIQIVRKGKKLECLIDTADYPLVSAYRWTTVRGHNTFYAVTQMRASGVSKATKMHRLLIPGFDEIDHRNRNGLDNQRGNLRPCTHHQNIANSVKRRGTSSVYKGVHRHKQSGKFVAHIRVNKKNIHLGYFADEKEAARTYDAAALKYFGEFARTNFGQKHELLKTDPRPGLLKESA